MLEFLSNNWLWILLIGSMVFMHLGHGGHGGGHGGDHGGHAGCGGGHKDSETQEDVGSTSPPAPKPAPEHDHGAARSDPTRRW